MDRTSTIPPCSCASSRATGSPQAGPCSPPPESIPLLLAQLTDSSLSLLAIAESLNLSLTDLTALMARPDIADQLAAIHSAAAQRTRILAAQHLPLAVEVLASIASTHRDEDNALGFDAANPRHRILRLRHRESARRAASTLLRLANYFPPVARPSGPPALVGRTSRPPAPVASSSPSPALAAPSHAHDEVAAATESWRCPAPAPSSVPAPRSPLAANGSSSSTPPALVGRTSVSVAVATRPPVLNAPSHAHDEVGSATESWRCPAPAPSHAHDEVGLATESWRCQAPAPSSLLARAGLAPPRAHNTS